MGRTKTERLAAALLRWRRERFAARYHDDPALEEAALELLDATGDLRRELGLAVADGEEVSGG